MLKHLKLTADIIFTQAFYTAHLYGCLDLNITVNRGLRIVYNKYEKSLEELIETVAGITVHAKHLQFLITEVYKSRNQLNPELKWIFFM